MRRTKNEQYFKTWSNDMAYFLGFICADGHIATHRNMLSIQLNTKDLHILENFKVFLNYDGKIYFRKDLPSANLWIISKEITQDLMNFGLTRHKSQELKWIEQIPEQYISHFVRGYFDGDGHVGLAQDSNPNKKKIICKLVSTLPFIERLKKEFEKIYGIEIGSIQDNGSYFELYYSGQQSALKFLEWIYIDSNENNRLKRKYDIYQNYIAHLNDDVIETKKIDYNLAQAIRQDCDLNINELSLKYNVNRSALNDVLKNITHLQEDNRDSRSTLYIEAWGEKKHIKDWIKDERCVVDEGCLRDRILKRNVPAEIAMSTKPDKGKTLWANPDAKKKTYFFELDGEEKSILQWSKDPRCKVKYLTLKYRLLKKGMSLSNALS
jgi:hypothetical protein